MKKIIFQFVFFFILTASFAQMQQIGELSSGKVIDFKPIIDDDDSDIFGYLFLYQLDHLSKEEFHLRFVVLDKNLNKISSTDFKENSYQGFWGSSRIEINLAKKMNEQLIIGLNDNVYDNPAVDAMVRYAYLSDYLHPRYYTLDLEDFSLSSQFQFIENKKENVVYDESEKNSLWDFKFDQTIYPAANQSYVIFAQSNYDPPKVFLNHSEQRKRVKRGTRAFSLLNENFEEQWNAAINQDEDNAGEYSLEISDRDVLVMKKENTEDNAAWQDQLTVYDAQTGKELYKFSNLDDSYKMTNNKTNIVGNRLIIYNQIFEIDQKKLKNNKQLGYARIVLDKTTGEEQSRQLLLWSDFEPHLTFKNKYGKVKARGYGRLYAEDFISLQNGETIIVAEGYKNWKKPRVLDCYTIKLDENFKIVDSHKEELKSRKIKRKSQDINFSENGYFNYQYTQKLDQNPDSEAYDILCRDNDEKIKRGVDADWYLGMIIYSDGEFHKDELKLTHEDYRTYLEQAKIGSMLLIDDYPDSGVNMRLENINY